MSPEKQPAEPKLITTADIPRGSDDVYKGPQFETNSDKPAKIEAENYLGDHVAAIVKIGGEIEGGAGSVGELAASIDNIFFKSVLDNAEAGNLVTNRADGSVHVYTPDEILTQLETYLNVKKADSGNSKIIKFNVTRAGGLRSAVEEICKTPNSAASQAFEQALELRKEKLRQREEALEDLGEEAVEKTVKKTAAEVAAARRVIG